ncbi:MAG: chromate transporter [Candidatus Cloacimonadaceae bacterium]
MIWQLFITFFRIGLFSIGGGYPMLSMIYQEVAIQNRWLSHQEVTDMIAISQMTPGPIAINVATFIGYRQAGFWGAFFTTLGVILPSVILMLLIALFYFRLRSKPWFYAIMTGLRPLVIGLIIAAAWFTAKSAFVGIFGVIVFLACFFLSLKFKTNPIVILLLSALAGIIVG